MTTKEIETILAPFEDRQLFTKKEVNNMLGYGGGHKGVYSTIDRLIKSDQLESVKLSSGAVRIKRDSLVNFLNLEI